MKHKITYLGYRNEEWKHYAWDVEINGVHFSYSTGTGHATPYRNRDGKINRRPMDRAVITDPERQVWLHVPRIDDVLECLFSDAQAGQESFNDFCANYAYSNDSLKALDIYRACMESGEKLRKALGSEYRAEETRINNRRDAS